MSENQENMVVCPVSEDREWAMSEKFKRHFARRDELAANGGVCSACREKFRRQNGAFLHGHRELPADMNHHVQLRDIEKTIFAAHGVEPIVEPDFATIDVDIGWATAESEDAMRAAADVLSRLMEWIWEPTKVRSSLIRFAALTAGLRPDLLNDASYADIAKELGVTKQVISRSAVNFQDTFNLPFMRSRSSEARESMRQAQITDHWRKRPRSEKNAASETPQITPRAP